MPIVEHKKGEAMSPHLNRLIKARIKGQPLSFYMGTLFWPKDGWHDSDTGMVVEKPKCS